MELNEYERNLLSKRELFEWKCKCKALEDTLLNAMRTIRNYESELGYSLDFEDICSLQLPGMAILPVTTESYLENKEKQRRRAVDQY